MHRFCRYQGFTLVELVMVIAITAVLSFVAVPKFFNNSSFQERAFYDDVLSALRYAQKLAVATNCNIQVVIASNQYSVKRPGASDRSLCKSVSASDYTIAVLQPGTGAAYTGSQTGLGLTTTTLYFSALGTASSSAVITVGASKTITVVKDTGFVYASAF